MKNTLNEIKSLMLRMEDTPNGGSNFINEASCKWRDVTDNDQFYNVIAGLKQGNMITFGYVDDAKIVVPTKKIKNLVTKRDNTVPDYETFGKNLGEEGKIVNVVKFSIYNMPWQTQQNVGEKYGEWKKKIEPINAKFGIVPKQKKYDVTKINYGEKGGIQQYGGENQELTAHTYTPLNMYNIKPISVAYYLILEDGAIKQIDVNKLELLPEKENAAISRLRKAGATEEDIAPVIGMDFQRFEHSHVLFVSGTPDDGIPVVMINHNLSEKIGAESHRNAFVKIAQERYAKFM